LLDILQDIKGDTINKIPKAYKPNKKRKSNPTKTNGAHIDSFINDDNCDSDQSIEANDSVAIEDSSDSSQEDEIEGSQKDKSKTNPPNIPKVNDPSTTNTSSIINDPPTLIDDPPLPKINAPPAKIPATVIPSITNDTHYSKNASQSSSSAPRITGNKRNALRFRNKFR